jgi:hypothetical protein
MLTPLWLAAGISGAVLVGGGAVAAVVIATSGPLAHNQSAQSTAAASQTGTVEPSATFRATDTFDFNRIPAPDESSWSVFTGPEGRLRVKVPAGWKVESGKVEGVVDYKGSIGEWIKTDKPLPISEADAGRTVPGWVSVIVSTQPFPVRIEASPAAVLREEQLTSRLPARDGIPKGIRVRQLTSHPQFPDYNGELFFVSQDGRSGSLFLNVIAEVHFEATAQDIGIARAIIESAEVLP